MKPSIIPLIFICILLSMNSAVLAEEVSFTLEDRHRLIRLEPTLKEFKESIDKLFEQVDTRISELRQDMNNE